MNRFGKSTMHIKYLIINLIIFCFVLTCLGNTEQHFVHSPSNNFTVQTDASIVIPCVVENREGECHWLRSTRIIPAKTGKYNYDRTPFNGDCSITINKLNFEYDDGDWQCQVTGEKVDGSDSLISNIIRVTVLMLPQKPVIARASDLDKLRIKTKEVTELVCTSDFGNPPPMLRWFLNDIDITSNASTIIDLRRTKSVLKYVFQPHMNNGLLVCDSVHQLQNQSDSVYLDIVYEPLVSIDQSNYTVKEGDSLRVECKVQSNPRASFNWIEKSKPNIEFSRQSTLFIESTQKTSNQKIFECWAENQVGVSNKVSFTLNVLYPPSLISSSNKERVQLGQNVFLFCQFDGNPKPDIKWYHIHLVTGDIKVVRSDSNNTSNLVINSVKYSHEGDYFCEASNVIEGITKTVKSELMSIDVYGMPDFIDSEKTFSGRLGNQNEIALQFCSDPPPAHAYWAIGPYRLTIKLESDDQSSTSEQNENSVLERFNPLPIQLIQNQIDRNLGSAQTCYKTSLLIQNTQLEDERDYDLVIKNDIGTAEHNIKFKVITPLSVALLVGILIIGFILLFSFGMLVIIALRTKRKGLENMSNDVLKEDGQTITHKEDLENGTKTELNQLNINNSNDSYELVYANLEFPHRNQNHSPIPSLEHQIQQQQLIQQQNYNQALPLPKKQPPQVRPKPQIRPTHLRPTNGSATTEYAKLSFPNKADL